MSAGNFHDFDDDILASDDIFSLTSSPSLQNRVLPRPVHYSPEKPPPFPTATSVGKQNAGEDHILLNPSPRHTSLPAPPPPYLKQFRSAMSSDDSPNKSRESFDYPSTGINSSPPFSYSSPPPSPSPLPLISRTPQTMTVGTRPSYSPSTTPGSPSSKFQSPRRKRSPGTQNDPSPQTTPSKQAAVQTRKAPSLSEKLGGPTVFSSNNEDGRYMTGPSSQQIQILSSCNTKEIDGEEIDEREVDLTEMLFRRSRSTQQSSLGGVQKRSLPFDHSSTGSLATKRRKIAGPAGAHLIEKTEASDQVRSKATRLLPLSSTPSLISSSVIDQNGFELTAEEQGEEKRDQSPVVFVTSSNTKDECPETDPSFNEDFFQGPWLSMLHTANLFPFNQLKNLNTSPMLFNSIKSLQKQGFSSRVKALVVIIKRFSPTEFDSSIVLKDPTGIIRGTVHKQVLESFSQSFTVGTVLALRKVAVYNPTPFTHYLNITVDNILDIFPADSTVPREFHDLPDALKIFEPKVIFDPTLTSPPQANNRSGAGALQRSASQQRIFSSLSDYSLPLEAMPPSSLCSEKMPPCAAIESKQQQERREESYFDDNDDLLDNLEDILSQTNSQRSL